MLTTAMNNCGDDGVFGNFNYKFEVLNFEMLFLLAAEIESVKFNGHSNLSDIR